MVRGLTGNCPPSITMGTIRLAGAGSGEFAGWGSRSRPAAHALRRAYTLARAGPPTVRMTDRRPDWPTHMCGQASYSHVDHECGTGPSVSIDGRRLFREPGTVAVEAPCYRHLRASTPRVSRIAQ